MRPAGYSPYQHKEPRKKLSFRLPKLSLGAKKWLIIIGSVLITLLLLLYLAFGELRFFANHYFGLTFFKKDYLILLQNNYESRPGGGFITGYGEVSTSFGFPSDISFHNSYEIDTDSYVEPPFPHEKMLKNEWYEGYTFRDANWEPDFRDSAPTLIDFYQKKFPEKEVDGIIVVNFSVIEDLVERLGGLEVDGQTLNKNNLFSFLTYEVNNVDHHDETALIERKDILGEIAATLIPKAKWHPFKTRDTVARALNTKDIYLWLKNDRLQKKLEKKGWANHLELPPASDFLVVNIANLGSKKADRYLRKEVHHYVNMTKEIPEATTEIVVRYPGFKNTYTDDYKGYLRLMIPGAAQVQDNLLDSNVSDKGEFKVIEEELILPAGSKTTLAFTYTLPRGLLTPNEYRLRLIKQSGDEKHYSVIVETFQDSFIESEDFTARENRAFFSGMPEGDRDLSLRVLPDTLPPYPIEQVFDNLKTISIYWNEPIDPATGNDALNYTVTDLDHSNSEQTDEVKVIYAEVVDGSVSKLEVEGLNDQPEERYRIQLKNIRDASGNAIDPDPKNITAVQRINSENPLDEPDTENAFSL